MFGFTRKLDHLLRQQDALLLQQNTMARQFDKLFQFFTKELPMARESFEQLKGAVEHAANVKAAALVLIKQMGDRLTELANNPTPEELKALAAELTSHADALAEGISNHDT